MRKIVVAGCAVAALAITSAYAATMTMKAAPRELYRDQLLQAGGL